MFKELPLTHDHIGLRRFLLYNGRIVKSAVRKVDVGVSLFNTFGSVIVAHK